MQYAPDVDLEFFKECSSEELNDLVEILTRDPKDNSKERLTTELPLEALYKKHYPDHAKYWRLIAAELQTFGANSFATMFRGGKGVFYREILCDVCKKLKVNFNENSETQTIEWNLLQKIVLDSLGKMTDDEIRELFKSTELSNEKNIPVGSLSTSAIMGIVQLGGISATGIVISIATYISRFLTGRAITMAAGASLSRAAGMVFGPVGWAVTGIWTAVDIASPAYRVTAPAVIKVATMRLMKEKQKEEQILIQG